MTHWKKWSATLVGVLLVRAAVTAQVLPAKAHHGTATAGTHHSVKSSPDFGTAGTTVINVPSFAFQGNEPATDQIAHAGRFYRYFSAQGSDDLFAAVVGIPSGVVIDSLSINSCNVADADLTTILWRGEWNNNLPGDPAQIAAMDTTAGCGVDSVTNIGYEYDANLGGPLFLAVYWNTNHFDGTVAFDDVAIAFHRIVSPAPAVASFNDVPTSSPQFQFVEALVAAGVTAGCGGGNFCPNNPVTRGQMAVFLSKALGLHWPN